jgi:hypothetical protein
MKIIGVLLILVSTSLAAQDLKPLDHAAQYKKHHVKSRDTFKVKYLAQNKKDSTLTAHEEFNAKGQLIRFIEYYSKGEQMAIYTYEYNEAGKIIKNTVSLVFDGWKEKELQLTHDAKGRLLSRELPESVPNFWKKETFSYSPTGILTKSEQWYEVAGVAKPLNHKDYPPDMIQKDNSLNQIYDTKGLLIIHNQYVNGKIAFADCYSYSYF